ncbi:MAG: anti-sigma factor antagonist [Planctomycetes bacterium]|nr:anti-sigma factor antagonist [Planctomycetota bacterium]MCW8135975.1 anti-sigma factor antagonist [Planctomycetota bacterium]
MDDLTSIQELLPTAHTGVWHARFKTVVAGAQQNEPNRQDLVNCFDQHPEIEVLVLNTEKGEHSRAIQALDFARPTLLAKHRHVVLYPVPLLDETPINGWYRGWRHLPDRESAEEYAASFKAGTSCVLSVRTDGHSYGYSSVCVSGAVNQASGMDFMAAIDVAWTGRDCNHVLDFSRCTGISEPLLQWLVESVVQIRQSGLCVYLVGAQKLLRERLRVQVADGLFCWADTLESGQLQAAYQWWSTRREFIDEVYSAGIQDCWVMRVRNPFDTRYVYEFEAHFAYLRRVRNARFVILDSQEMRWIGSMGQGCLVYGADVLKGNGGELIFAGLHPKAAQTCEFLGLRSYFVLIDQLSDAIDFVHDHFRMPRVAPDVSDQPRQPPAKAKEPALPEMPGADSRLGRFAVTRHWPGLVVIRQVEGERDVLVRHDARCIMALVKRHCTNQDDWLIIELVGRQFPKGPFFDGLFRRLNNRWGKPGRSWRIVSPDGNAGDWEGLTVPSPEVALMAWRGRGVPTLELGRTGESGTKVTLTGVLNLNSYHWLFNEVTPKGGDIDEHAELELDLRQVTFDPDHTERVLSHLAEGSLQQYYKSVCLVGHRGLLSKRLAFVLHKHFKARLYKFQD